MIGEHAKLCFTFSFAHIARDIDFFFASFFVTENRGFIVAHWRVFSAYSLYFKLLNSKLRVHSVLQLVNMWALPVNTLTVVSNFEGNHTLPLAVPQCLGHLSEPGMRSIE